MPAVRLLTLIFALTVVQITSTSRYATIDGVVTRVGAGSPVRGARVSVVRINSDTGAEIALPTAMTDDSGRFAFSRVEPGEYRLSVERDGFIRHHFGQRKIGGSGRVVQLNESQTLTVAFELVPAGVITGRVLDDHGEPMAGAIVNAQRFQYQDGNPIPVRGQAPGMADASTLITRATTDDRGEYRLFWFPPGDYYISVNARPRVFASALIDAGAPQRGEGPFPDGRLAFGPEQLAAIYYPGVVGMDAAMPVTVPASGEVRIDINWRPVQLASVRGRFILPELPPMLTPDGRLRMQTQGGSMVLTQVDGRRGINTGIVGRGDQFEFRGVAPGSYFVNILQRQNDLTFFGKVRVDVGDRDVDGVTVSLQPSVTLRGRIILDSVPPQSFAFNRLRVSGTDAVGWGGNSTTQVTENGTFGLARLLPTKLRLTVDGLPSGAFVAMARYGNSDLLTDEFIPIEDQELELHVSFASGKIAGSVLDANGMPYSGALVTLVPEERKRSRFDLYFTRTSDANGQFNFSTVPEGAFKIFAWEQIPTGAYQSAQFLQRFENLGRFVGVANGSSDSLQLQLIPEVD